MQLSNSNNGFTTPTHNGASGFTTPTHNRTSGFTTPTHNRTSGFTTPTHNRTFSSQEIDPTLSHLFSTLLKVIAAAALIAVFYLPHFLPQLVVFAISSATLGIVIGTVC